MESIRLYRTRLGPIVDVDGRAYRVSAGSWDDLFVDPRLRERLQGDIRPDREVAPPTPSALLPPLTGQEVWAAGVTYLRSRAARVDESKAAGGDTFYDRVYEADRPELFFKATPHRVVGPGGHVRVRADSTWSVPEPELALAVDPRGRIFGYSIGNDMSARDIEGDNPLYLPQAKTYDQCCAIGPGILVTDHPLPDSTRIELAVERNDDVVFQGGTTLAAMRRSPRELVEYLFRDNSFPLGCYLLTGTGIVPPDGFGLKHGDRVRIEIASIGVLENAVVRG